MILDEGGSVVLGDVLAAVGRELTLATTLARSLEDAATVLVRAAPSMSDASTGLQNLDLLAQRLDGLSTFVAALAAEVDGAVRVDVSRATRDLSLADLARRLRLEDAPTPDLAAVELF